MRKLIILLQIGYVFIAIVALKMPSPIFFNQSLFTKYFVQWYLESCISNSNHQSLF